MTVKFSNNATSRLVSSISSATTTISVMPGDGAKFPVLAAGEWFPVTLVNSGGMLEICRCTGRVADTLTVVRGQEGTPPTDFSAGDRVELRMTSGAFDASKQECLDAAKMAGADYAGVNEPEVTWPYMTWADAGAGLLKRRNAANNDWAVEGELFQRSARRNGDSTQDFSAKKLAAESVTTGDIAASSLNGGQLAGHRNKIINGAFHVNQDDVSGTITLDAGEYGHDMWKAGAGGCTYTFATVGGVTTITITAGTLVQIVEWLNLMAGKHVMSWGGTAQGRINGGTYGDSGVIATLTGGENATVEFGAGTLSLVQLEPGEISTPFEHRIHGAELSLCQRYFEIKYFLYYGYQTVSSSVGCSVNYSQTKRVMPTITIRPAGSTLNVYAMSSNDVHIHGCNIYAQVVNTGPAIITGFVVADARL